MKGVARRQSAPTGRSRRAEATADGNPKKYAIAEPCKRLGLRTIQQPTNPPSGRARKLRFSVSLIKLPLCVATLPSIPEGGDHMEDALRLAADGGKHVDDPGNVGLGAT